MSAKKETGVISKIMHQNKLYVGLNIYIFTLKLCAFPVNKKEG